MSLEATPIYDGQLPATKTTLYTVAGSKRVIVKHISVTNTDSSSRTFNLYVNRSGTSRRITPKDMNLDAGENTVKDDPIVLDEGDLIEGDASVANKLDVVIDGAIEEV